MATTQLMESNREGAEIYHGEAVCKEKCHKTMEEFGLPKGLMPLDDIEELGFNRSTGYFWLNHKKKKEHKFTQIGQTVVYDLQVTAFLSQRRLSKITGVKAKELLIMVTLRDIFIEDPASGKISFSIGAGLTKTHPISAFKLEDEKKDDAKVKK